MSFFQGHLIPVLQVEDGYDDDDEVPQDPQAIVTP